MGTDCSAERRALPPRGSLAHVGLMHLVVRQLTENIVGLTTIQVDLSLNFVLDGSGRFSLGVLTGINGLLPLINDH